MASPLWVAKVTRHPLGDRPHVQATFPKCACGEMRVKSFSQRSLRLASVECSLVAKVKMVFVSSVRTSNRAPPKPHPRRECGLCCVGPALPVPQLLEHETKGKCNKAKAAPASTSGTLGPSTTGHGPGMPIEIDGPADATTAALAAALDAALAATATQHSGNSGADSRRLEEEAPRTRRCV